MLWDLSNVVTTLWNAFVVQIYIDIYLYQICQSSHYSSSLNTNKCKAWFNFLQIIGLLSFGLCNLGHYHPQTTETKALEWYCGLTAPSESLPFLVLTAQIMGTVSLCPCKGQNKTAGSVDITKYPPQLHDDLYPYYSSESYFLLTVNANHSLGLCVPVCGAAASLKGVSVLMSQVLPCRVSGLAAFSTRLVLKLPWASHLSNCCRNQVLRLTNS